MSSRTEAKNPILLALSDGGYAKKVSGNGAEKQQVTLK
jgi:hypothetical protein